MALSDEIASGDRQRALEALREAVAAQLEEAEPKEAAALSRELRQILGELDKLSAGARGDSVDDLAARRAARRSDAANRERSAQDQ